MVVLKGEKASMPLHVKQEEEGSFWSSFEATESGIVVVLDDATEQLSGGVFIDEYRLLELLTILDVKKGKKRTEEQQQRTEEGTMTKEEFEEKYCGTKESNNDESGR